MFTDSLMHAILYWQAAIGAEIWLDPNEEECRLSNGTLVLSCMPALTTLTSVWQTGRISPAQVLSVRLGLLQTSLADQIYSARRHARTDVMTSTPSSPKHCSIVLRVVNFELCDSKNTIRIIRSSGLEQ